MSNYLDPATLERIISVLQRRVGNVERLGAVGGSGGLNENDVLNILGYQNIVWVGDANYRFKATDTASLIVFTPGAGVTRLYQLFDFNTEPAFAGNWQDVVNLGPGALAFSIGSNVVTHPTGGRNVAVNADVTVKLIDVTDPVSTFFIRGGVVGQSPTPQAPLNAALPTIGYPPGLDATTAGTLFITSDGAWNDPSTGLAITPTAISRAWLKNGTSLGGGGTQFTLVRPGDEGFTFACDVRATGPNGQTSAYYRSNSLQVTAPSIARFTAPYPKIVGSSGQDITQAAVNEFVELALGPTPPSILDVEIFNPSNDQLPPYDGVGISRGHPSPPDYAYQIQTGDGSSSEKIYFRLTHDGLAADGSPSPTETAGLLCVPEGQQGTVPPPGGTTPPPTTGTRDASVQPFGVHSPWNEPMKTGATFGGATNVMTKAMRNTDGIGGGAYVDGPNGYGIQPTYASAGDQFRTIRTLSSTGVVLATKTAQVPDTRYITTGSDHNFVCYFPDRSQADDSWLTVNNGLNLDCRATTRHYVDERGSGFDRGVRAAGCSVLGGLIRSAEFNALSIPHAVVVGIGAMKAHKGWVWPAISEDSNSSQYGPVGDASVQNGAIPMGQLFAIPPSVNIETIPSITAIGKAIGYALQRYGLYVCDTGYPLQTANCALKTEQTVSAATITDAAAQWGILRQYCDAVTNATQNTPKGAGTTLVAGAAYADPIDGGGIVVPPPVSGGRPVLDADITWASWSSWVGAVDWGHSTQGGINRYGLFMVGIGRGDGTVSYVSVNGTLCPRIGLSRSGNTTTDRQVEVFEVINPPANASLLSHVEAPAFAASALQFEFLTFSDVLQGTPHGTVGTATVGSGTLISVSAGAATSDLIIAVAAIRSTRSSASLGGGQTGLANGLGSPSGSASTNLLFAVSRKPGSGTTPVVSTFEYGPSADRAAAVAIPLRFAGSGALPPVAGTTLTKMIQNDEANYRVGTFTPTASTVDYSERHPLNATKDWSYGPRISSTPFASPTPPPVNTVGLSAMVQRDMTTNAETTVYLAVHDWQLTPRHASSLTTLQNGTYNNIVPWNFLCMGSTRNTAQVEVIIRDYQLWGRTPAGAWVRIAYNVGCIWNSMFTLTAAPYSGLGDPIMTSNTNKSGSTQDQVGLWPSHNCNATDPPYAIHAAGAQAVQSSFNYDRFLVACRAALVTPNANAHYTMIMAADRKHQTGGVVDNDGFDFMVSRAKGIPTNGAFRLYAAFVSAGTQDFSSMPTLTNVQASDIF